MRARNSYYHINTYDIALEVLSIPYYNEKIVKIKGNLFNRHNGVFYERGTYTIKRSDLKKWRILE